MNEPRVEVTPRRVLVVEDDETLRTAVRYALEREGFQVLAAADGVSGLRSALTDRPHVVILDLMLPGMDGLEVCRRIRAASSVPVLILTARSEEVDKVVGLELGADDYVTKPFSMRELTARVRALLRRSPAVDGHDAPEVLAGAGVTVDLRARRVLRGDRPLSLNPKEFDLLVFFLRHPNQVLSREQILDAVWGYDFVGGTRTVDVHVRWLREKIEEQPSQPVHLQTVRGSGYRFAP
ncbi:MAG TPA: response regulator transcription factor [Dehalococcoidia bacterium]